MPSLCFFSPNLIVDSTYGNNHVMWQPKSSMNNPRGVTLIPEDSPPEECPIVYRKWTSTSLNAGVWYHIQRYDLKLCTLSVFSILTFQGEGNEINSKLFLFLVPWVARTAHEDVDNPASNAIDGDNTTLYMSKNRKFPWMNIDLGKGSH